MPATRVRHTLSSSTSRTCTSEGEELAIAFAPYATSLDVWESNRRLRTSVVVSRAVVVAAPTRFARVCTSPDASPVCAVGVAAPNPRVFVRAASAAHLRCVSSPRGVRPHTQNGRSFTRTFFSFLTNDVARSAVGIAIPSISPLCGGRQCFVRVRGVFEFISTVSRKTVLSPGTTPKQFIDSQNPAWHLKPRRF